MVVEVVAVGLVACASRSGVGMAAESDADEFFAGPVGKGKSAVIEAPGPPPPFGFGNEVGKEEGSVCGRYAVAVCMSRLDDMYELPADEKQRID